MTKRLQLLFDRLALKAEMIARKRLRDQVVRMQSELIARHLETMYEDIYTSFENLSVTMTVFGDQQVSFKIRFSNRANQSMKHLNFFKAKLTIVWLEKQYEEMSRIANFIKNVVEPKCFHLTSCEMKSLENIETTISCSQLSFESGLYQVEDFLRSLTNEHVEQLEDEKNKMKINKGWGKRIFNLLHAK